MAAVTTNLSLCSPVLLSPSSTRNPRRLHGYNKSATSRLSVPAKPFPSLPIRISKSSSSLPTFTPATPLFPTSRSSSIITRSTRSLLTQLPSITKSTRSLATLAALAMALARALAHKLFRAAQTSSPGMGDAIRFSVQTGGHGFFASLREPPPGYLITPQTVVAIVMKKWLDTYSDVLMLRMLLSWFPNLPWKRQPLSAVRELCDPYLNLFRDIIPPVFENDLNQHLALSVLGILRSILDVDTGYRRIL